jgi:hypothetical protein
MTDTPNTEELIARLEHAAMGFAQDRSEHTERRLNAARKILIDAQAAELARRDEVISLKNRNIEDLLEQLARLRAERVPEGWRIERKDNKPFKNIEVTAPNGYTALVGSIDRNPSIVLYMLAEALLSPPPPAQPAPPSADARDKLAAFGAWAAEEFREELGDVDGGSAQDAMERLGVLVLVTVTEPCSGFSCRCAEYGDWPMQCYRYPADVRAAIDAAAGKGDA